MLYPGSASKRHPKRRAGHPLWPVLPEDVAEKADGVPLASVDGAAGVAELVVRGQNHQYLHRRPPSGSARWGLIKSLRYCSSADAAVASLATAATASAIARGSDPARHRRRDAGRATADRCRQAASSHLRPAKPTP